MTSECKELTVVEDTPTMGVLVAERPLQLLTRTVHVPQGITIDELVEFIQPNPIFWSMARVIVNGEIISPWIWDEWIIRPDEDIIVKFVPQGGGKSPLRIILTIAIIVAAPFVGEFLAPFIGLNLSLATGSLVSFATVSAVGTLAFSALAFLALNALVPLSRPKLRTEAGSSNFSITGSRNAIRHYAPIPKILGTHRTFPPGGILPFTQSTEILKPLVSAAGGRQILTIFVIVGYGPLAISEIKIGETAIGEFENVTLEVIDGSKYYQASTISFNPADNSINDSAAGFPAFVEGEVVRLKGSTSNEGRFRVLGANNRDGNGLDTKANPTASKIIVDRTVVTEAAGASMEIEVASTIVESDIFQESLAIRITDTFTVRTTQPDTDEISIDFELPFGLFTLNKKGKRVTTSFVIEFSFVETGGSDWQTAPFATGSRQYPTFREIQENRGFRPENAISTSITFSGRTKDAGRYTLKFRPGKRAQWDVRVKRTLPEVNLTDDRVFDRINWSALRSIRNEDPLNIFGLATVGVRIVATEQLSGVIDQLNMIASSLVPDWNGANWDTIQITSNPAALVREIFQGKGTARPLTDAQLDLPSFQIWHDNNAIAGKERNFNMVFDFDTSVGEAVNTISTIGHARIIPIDGKMTVIEDKQQSLTVAKYNPRNTFGFTYNKVFIDAIHAFRVRFILADSGWRQTERIVYSDGFSERGEVPGTVAATAFQELEFPGVTDTDQIWRETRRAEATIRLRPDSMSFSTDAEGMVPKLGQRVEFTHDVILVGLGDGRLAMVNVSGGFIDDFDLDEFVTMEMGKFYAIRIMRDDGTIQVHPVDTVVGTSKNLIVTSATVPDDNGEKAGDLFSFGEAGTDIELLILKSITTNPDLVFNFVLVDEGTGIHTSDSGTIPAWTPVVTLPQDPTTFVPVVLDVDSGEEIAILLSGGGHQLVIQITLEPILNVVSEGIKNIFVRWRETGTTSDFANQMFDRKHATLGFVRITPVEKGVSYDIELAFVGDNDIAGRFTTVTHVVSGADNPPPDVENFRVTQSGFNAVFSWDEVVVSDLAGYEIRISDAALFNWDKARILSSTEKGTVTTLAHVEPGFWKFAIKAVDLAENVSEVENVVAFEIKDTAVTTIVRHCEGPRFLGTLTNLEKHWTGKLRLKSTDADSTGADFDVFDTYTLNPFTTAEYESEVFDLGSTQTVRVWITVDHVPGPGETDKNVRVQLKFGNAPTGLMWNDADLSVDMWSNDPAGQLMWNVLGPYQDWTVGTITARFFQYKLLLDITKGQSVIEQATLNIVDEDKDQIVPVLVSDDGSILTNVDENVVVSG